MLVIFLTNLFSYKLLGLEKTFFKSDIFSK